MALATSTPFPLWTHLECLVKKIQDPIQEISTIKKYLGDPVAITKLLVITLRHNLHTQSIILLNNEYKLNTILVYLELEEGPIMAI